MLWDLLRLAVGFRLGLKAPSLIYKPSVPQNSLLAAGLQG